MASIEETLQKAVEGLEIPGAVMVANSADGMFLILVFYSCHNK